MAGEEELWELVGDLARAPSQITMMTWDQAARRLFNRKPEPLLLSRQGKKNGEKRLRTLILHTPEWSNRDACRCAQQF